MEKQEGSIANLFRSLFIEGEGEEYLDVINSSGHRFYVPYASAGTGLTLYHPSRIRGKLIKQLLPAIKYSTLWLSKLGFRRLKLKTSPVLQDVLTSLFPDKELRIAVFCGTPGVHRKITIQISHKNSILAYAKITDKPCVKDLFDQESKLLSTLRERHIHFVPQVLLQKEIAPGIELFVQNTVKKDKRLFTGWQERAIWDFLSALHSKTAINIGFKDTDYYTDLQQLKEFISIDKWGVSTLLQDVIQEVERFFSTHEVLFSVYHGDLTPWNSYLHQNKLYVFDWEYAKQTYPPFLDYFHYFTQSAFYERRWDATETIQRFHRQKAVLQGYISHPSLYYKAYLLSIIHFYMERDKNSSNDTFQAKYDRWINLLTLIN